VGHVDLDRQHRQLFQLCERASECADADAELDESFHAVINDLMQYAMTHFEYEESVLAQCHYPELDAQKSSHLEFIAKMTAFIEAAMNDQLEKSKVADFVLKWLIVHVLVSDMKYRSAVMQWQHGEKGV